MNLPAALDVLVAQGPAILATGRYPDRRCILATKVGLEVLTAVGIVADPFPVEAAVYTAAVRDERPGGRIIVIKRENAGPGWSGHLVLTGPGAGAPWLLDLDLRQFQRPALERDGIQYEALTVPPAAWWPFDPTLPGWTWGDDETGASVTYRPLADASFRRSRAWRDTFDGPLRADIGRLVRAVRAAAQRV